MNERIRELAEQAKGFVDLNQHIGGTNGCMVYTYDGLEKFAELIVRECMGQMAIQMQNFGDDQSNNPCWYKSEEAILKHFGVE